MPTTPACTYSRICWDCDKCFQIVGLAIESGNWSRILRYHGEPGIIYHAIQWADNTSERKQEISIFPTYHHKSYVAQIIWYCFLHGSVDCRNFDESILSDGGARRNKTNVPVPKFPKRSFHHNPSRTENRYLAYLSLSRWSGNNGMSIQWRMGHGSIWHPIHVNFSPTPQFLNSRCNSSHAYHFDYPTMWWNSNSGGDIAHCVDEDVLVFRLSSCGLVVPTLEARRRTNVIHHRACERRILQKVLRSLWCVWYRALLQNSDILARCLLWIEIDTQTSSLSASSLIHAVALTCVCFRGYSIRPSWLAYASAATMVSFICWKIHDDCICCWLTGKEDEVSMMNDDSQ